MAIIRCKRCNEKYSDLLDECPSCNEVKRKNRQNNTVLIIGFSLIILCIIFFLIHGYLVTRCMYEDCYNNSYKDGVNCWYCTKHAQEVAEVLGLSSNESSSSSSSSNKVYLMVKDVYLSKGSSHSNYYTASGAVYNYGSITAKYVKVKVKFLNSYGKIVDTDWTYAVGTEGIEPGETVKWSCMVEKDYAIESIEAEIIDYDY